VEVYLNKLDISDSINNTRWNELVMVGWLTARMKYVMHIQDDEMNTAKHILS